MKQIKDLKNGDIVYIADTLKEKIRTTKVKSIKYIGNCGAGKDTYEIKYTNGDIKPYAQGKDTYHYAVFEPTFLIKEDAENHLKEHINRKKKTIINQPIHKPEIDKFKEKLKNIIMEAAEFISYDNEDAVNEYVEQNVEELRNLAKS